MLLSEGIIMHRNEAIPLKRRAPMIRTHSHRQLTLAGFDWPFQTSLDSNNRWVKMSECIPWDDLAEAYHTSLSSTQGRPAKEARLMIGAVIIKHKKGLSDRETVAEIQESPYLQFFVGLPGFQMEAPFAPSLFVEVRKRMGDAVFDAFCDAVIEAVKQAKSKPTRQRCTQKDAPTGHAPPPSGSDSEAEATEPVHQGKLILDATVAPQAIRFPTDLSLLNEAREFSEKIIDRLYARTELKKKPRTYRQKARKAYLSVVKKKRPGSRVL